MNKIFKILLIAVIGLSISKCTTSDDTAEVVLNDFTVQRDADNTIIETYLKTHHMEVILPNFDVKFSTVASMSSTCMWVENQLVGATFPLMTKTCKANDISYTIYYIKLQEGGTTTINSRKPCNLDGVWAAYKGRLMDEFVAKGTLVGGVATTADTGGISANDEGTVFDSNDNPNSFFELDQVVRGWAEIFPLFKTGSYLANADGTTTYSDFGAGVMFLPSGLAYFNGSVGSIPSYSPLIFNFKLFEIKRNDHDGDGIKDFEEDLDGDGYIYTTAANGATFINGRNIDDTDSDGYVDVYDGDDDDDYYLTRTEIKRPALFPAQYDENGVPVNTGYYPYKGTIDDPTTPYINEALGVPRKFTVPINPLTQLPINSLQTSDFTDEPRLRNYLDVTVHP
jgi:hypothetical protein